MRELSFEDCYYTYVPLQTAEDADTRLVLYWYNVSCVELTFSSVCCCWREARLEATIILLSSLLFKNLFLMSNKYSMSL